MKNETSTSNSTKNPSPGSSDKKEATKSISSSSNDVIQIKDDRPRKDGPGGE